MEKDTAILHFSGGKYLYFEDTGLPDLLKSIDKLDDFTVRVSEVRLNRPDAPLLATMAMPFSIIQSAEYPDYLSATGRTAEFDEKGSEPDHSPLLHI